MHIRFKFLVIILVLSIISYIPPSYAQKKKQTKTQLQSQQKKIERNIKYTKRLLNETKNKKRTSLNQLSLIQKQVKDRKSLINSYGNEITLIDNQIRFDRENITLLQAELITLKKEYANLIYQSYKSKNNYDKWMFIFASKDFYQAMRRMRYLKEYNAYRRQKATKIEQTQVELKKDIESLEKQKNERLGLLISKENETQELEKDRLQKRSIINNLQQKEKDLKGKLQKQQREWNKLNKEIQKIIEKEINPNGNRPQLSPAEVQLSKNFVSNIGKLPWPTKRGNITSHFGKHNHPQLHVVINNKGVDFSCEKGTTVSAVFDGEVVKVLQLPRYKAVLLKHGDYFTVYNKLQQVFVTEGEMVKTNQNLGVVWTDSESGESVLHFELLKQINYQNPEKWLIRR